LMMESDPRAGDLARRRALAEAVHRRLLEVYGEPAPRTPGPLLDGLIRTVLSQQTSDRNWARAYRALRERFPTWAQVAAAAPEEIEEAIRPGGLARRKSRQILEILRRVRERSGAYDLEHLRGLDDDGVREELLPWPGVGAKTVACLLLFSLGRDVCPVDTHVHRVARRLGLAPGARTPEQTERRLAECLPRGAAYAFHVNVIRLGRTLCRPSRPRCGECPLGELCTWS